MNVYTIGRVRSGVRVKELDGDWRKVFPAGFEFHPVTHGARLPDGTSIDKKPFYQGVRVHPEHIPRTMERGGTQPLSADIGIMSNIFYISRRFLDLIESIEPDVHQYPPVQLVYKGGAPAELFYWLFPCNRIDGMDREHTTHEFNEKIGYWKHVNGKQYVVNLAQVAGRHIWIEARLFSDTVFVSETLRKAIEKAGLKGIGFHEMAAC